MPLNANDLIQEINKALNAKNKDNNLIDPPKEMKAFAEGLILSIQGAVVSHSSVSATAPAAPGPVLNIEAKDGKALIAPIALISRLKKDISPDATKIESEAKKHTDYLSDNLKIDFNSGVLKGNSTAAPGTPPIPGFLIAGGNGGALKGINGEDWAKAVIVDKGDLAQSKKIFIAIADYIKDNGEAVYPPASVSGAFAKPGSSLKLGVGVGGTII